MTNGAYKYWTANGWVSDLDTDVNNPPTASLPVKNTPELTAKTQILPASGSRNVSGAITNQGIGGYYLSGTSANIDTPFVFRYRNTVLTPTFLSVDAYTYTSGESIRCVRP